MDETNAGNLAAASELAGKIAVELLFAKPGKNEGLLPVNCLLSQIEELGGVRPTAPALDRAVKLARRWVDQIFENTGTFDSESIKRLTQWAQWLQAACAHVLSGHPEPEWPADWFETTSLPRKESVDIQAVAAAAKAAEEEPAMALDFKRDGELLREFVNESHEHLQAIELGVLQIEQNDADADILNSVFRAFHTFKGSAGLLNLTRMYHLAHELESLLDRVRKHTITVSPTVINLILEGRDLLKQYVVEIDAQLAGQAPIAPLNISTRDVVERVRAFLSGNPAPEKKSSTDVEPSAKAVVRPPESNAATKPAEEVPAPVAPPEAVAAPATERVQTAAVSSAGGERVRVDTVKLDSMVDLVGELIIAQSQVIHDADLLATQNPRLARNLARLGRITSELQRTALSLRMVPVRGAFQKMVRLVRDLAAKQGKQVDLKLTGEDTELDRTVVDQINDPLVHMIRNAVDHGIESPEARKAAGKPPTGTIHLRASHQSGNFAIEVQDDGGGLKREKILAKARNLGMIAPGAQPTDEELFDLIFEPGFSTAEKVSEVSGRGVGMDVVRRNVERLRGKISIGSQAGKGTTFTVCLPLTLAIIDGLMVRIGTQCYILPTLDVSESFRPTAEMITPVQGRGEVVDVRGKLCPLLRLGEIFGVSSDKGKSLDGIIVVVGSGRESRCLLVDELLGKQEVVLKSLGETFKQNKLLEGAAILGDGSVGLILDVDALLQRRTSAAAQAA